MATQILAAVARRPGAPSQDDVVLAQYESRDGRLTPRPRSVPVRERPPAVTA